MAAFFKVSSVCELDSGSCRLGGGGLLALTSLHIPNSLRNLPLAPVLALSFRILPCHQEPMFTGLLSLPTLGKKTFEKQQSLVV